MTTTRSGVVSILTIEAHLMIDSQQCYTDPTPSYTKHAADPVPLYSETEDNSDDSSSSSKPQQKALKVYSGARGGLARSVPITVPVVEPPGSIKSIISSLGARKAPSKRYRLKSLRSSAERDQL